MEKKTAQNLQEQIEFIAEVIQNCAVAIFIIDSQHLVIYWNKACEKLTGVKGVDIIGTRDHWKPFYDHQRPCISDLVIDGTPEEMKKYYDVSGTSTLLTDGLHGEGWYSNLGGKDRYIIFDAAPIYNRSGEILAAIETLQDITELKRVEEERKRLVDELQDALNKVRTLRGLIPICASCKKIRDDKGYWNQIETYVRDHSEAEFSHSICPECAKKLYPNLKHS